MSPDIKEIENLAIQAGAVLRQRFGQSHQVQYKSAIDPVTEVDREVEALLLEHILRRYPDHRIETEESGCFSGKNHHAWFIDPLDGTLNYAHNVPHFTVSIAYAENGILKLAAIYDPMLDESFTAVNSEGARLNGKIIRVSTTESLERCLLETDFASDVHTNPDNNLEEYVLFSLHAQSVRQVGSAARALCYVAAGRLDGYWNNQLSSWDLAAGALIAEEAGAKVTSMYGDPNFFKLPYSVLAANPQIHPQMLDLLLQARRKRESGVGLPRPKQAT